MTEENELDPKMVEAAIRAGEKAAAEDMKADAEKARAERDDMVAQLAEANEAVEAAKAEAKDATARLARLQADWDNYRKRTAQERVAERARATEKLVEGLLPVVDDLEHAIDHAENSGDQEVKEYANGVIAVHQKLLDVLSREGVSVIDPAGEPFDPMREQAVGKVEDAEAYDDTVAQVMRRGYEMAGRVLRPAMVSVTFGGPKRPADEADGDQDAD